MPRASETLSRAVLAIYPDIEERISSMEFRPNERILWETLACCILSSQVPYSLAQAATNAIMSSGTLLRPIKSDEELFADLLQSLNKKLQVGNSRRRYRFPVARAQQLAATKIAVTKGFGSLTQLLDFFEDPDLTRAWLVKNAPGMGPKQASMFLRNVGYTYELAILDRHVLNYMAEVGILKTDKTAISGILRYREYEGLLQDHAAVLGTKIGLLDWAIWIVMRAKQSRSSEQLSFNLV